MKVRHIAGLNFDYLSFSNKVRHVDARDARFLAEMRSIQKKRKKRSTELENAVLHSKSKNIKLGALCSF